MGLTPKEQQIVLLNEQIEKLKTKRFMNQMVDHWSDDNYAIDRECLEEIKKLEAELKELEKESV